MEPLRRVRRHIAWVLIVKIGLIALLHALFFSSSARPAIDGDAVGDRIQTPSR